MKRFAIIFLAALLTFSLCACGKNEAGSQPTTTVAPTTTIPDDPVPTTTAEPTEQTQPANPVPEGCTYILADGTQFAAGEGMPTESHVGDAYITPEYTYLLENSGWSVKVNNTNKESYGPLLAEINGKALTSMAQAFAGCSIMPVSPAIPDTVTDMTEAYSGCHALVTAPVIPASVTSLARAFGSCYSLTGLVEIHGVSAMYRDCANTCGNCENEGVTCETCNACANVAQCFDFTELPITLIGTSPCLAELAATDMNGNVKLESEAVYSQADVANSIELLESWAHNWPDFSESQTVMTQFGRNYIITPSEAPICRIRSVEVLSSSVNSVACQVYQTRDKEHAQVLAEKFGVHNEVTTEILAIIHIVTPQIEVSDGDRVTADYEILFRFTLENGQILDLRYCEDVLYFGTGGMLTDCTPEDFQ